MELQEQQIVIFMTNGKTLLFNDVKSVEFAEGCISFDYFGKSTQEEKSAIFFFENIAGWSASVDILEELIDE